MSPPAPSRSLIRIEWASTNEFTAVPAEEAIASGLTGSTTRAPNVDFDIEIIEDGSSGRRIAKPLRVPATAICVAISPSGRCSAWSRANISPRAQWVIPGCYHESENLDFSLEWYYGDASYVSVGYFDKSVKTSSHLASRKTLCCSPIWLTRIEPTLSVCD